MSGERFMTRDHETIRRWVGAKRRASRIVAYREDELGGEFHSLHDITHIDGVGEKTARLIMEKGTLD